MKQQTLTDHLIELRNRLICCILFLFIAVIFSYIYSTDIYNFLLQPLIDAYGDRLDRRIIYTSPAEAFTTYIKLSFFSGFFLSFPAIAFQSYFFIAPGLYKSEKKTVISILLFSPLLFVTGAALAYYFIFPLCFEFFLSFEVSGAVSKLPIEMEARISEYLDLVIQLILGFGMAFQLPVILVFLVKIGILSVESLRKKRKYWAILIFILAAILTPPDAISQLTMAIPMLLLYEIAILVATRIKKSN